MRRSARLSGINGVPGEQDPDSAEDASQDVTAILNAEAGSQNQQSSPKRKHNSTPTDYTGHSPNKRRAGEPISTATPTPANPTDVHSATRSSGRLQARVSLAPRPPVNPRNQYELPDSPEAVAATRPAIEPPKKLRALNKTKQKQLLVSPFRGRGELDIRTTATVYLDDSPRKIPTRNKLQKIGTSFLKLRPTTHQKDSNNAPFDGEDVLAEAFRQAVGPETPALPPVQLSASTAREPQSTPARKSPTKKPSRGRAAPGRTPETVPGECESAQNSRASKVVNPLAHAALQTQHEQINSKRAATSPKTRAPAPRQAGPQDAADEPIDEHEPDDQVDEHSPSEAGQDEPASAPASEPEADRGEDNRDRAEEDGAVEDDSRGAANHSASHRPETEAERRRREQEEAEEEAKRQERIQAAMQGIEDAAQVYECGPAWEKALVGAAELVGHRTHTEPTSTNGRAVARPLKILIKAYKRLRRAEPESLYQLTETIQDNRLLFRERCDHISSYKIRPDMRRDRQRKRMVRDIFEHLVPDSMKLAKCVLRARFQDGDLSRIALKDVVRFLHITMSLVESANEWLPRPIFDNKNKSIMKSAITQNIAYIIRRYSDEIADVECEKYRNELEIKQQAELQSLRSRCERKRAAVREKYRSHAMRANRQPVAEIVDIDELDVDNQQGANDDHGTTAAQTLSSHDPSRSQARREPTEEIPAPPPLALNDKETMVLLHALQVYTSETRFQDIMDAYGGDGGKLGRFDMDQIMALARWIKQTMALQLQNRSDRQWDYLRSIPD
ncbi:hypothetical protein LTR99_006207 [Exophiala xenobiotica]|uniref:Uncharacterized protein n=1 Tax=Vermiconidia calcicola TaxID=1690605 RepID=A0AAV9QBC8_9PEZI|nr:hypothetical protein H2202_009605 [Exophiala xenobiotica]KAK5534241.1 hypothetical protein LTR23_008913 [Chaetothyriales sp. CCFEE 6169]KAK5537378.1 hypothetical protein LTR25_004629 [Vermiconidia calcicola]KAK5189673.1 hypothetical protein LTR92_010374 [Exophiala xenobiotica]KAK5206187.1 hypothetical protein LTR41_008056 [Exophiala xenobiotica]